MNTEEIQIEFKKAWAALSSLRSGLSDSKSIDEKYVDLFHTELDRLAATGMDLGEFRVPANQMKPVVTSYSPSQGTKYSSARYVDRDLLVIKLDTVLSFFKICDRKVNIGFSG